MPETESFCSFRRAERNGLRFDPLERALEMRRQRFNPSEFDRASVIRGFRAGYQVSLVGREQELKVFLTANLETAGHRAEEVAAEGRPTVSDQL